MGTAIVIDAGDRLTTIATGMVYILYHKTVVPETMIPDEARGRERSASSHVASESRLSSVPVLCAPLKRFGVAGG